MTFTPYPWKNKAEAQTTPLDRQELNKAEEAIGAFLPEYVAPKPTGIAATDTAHLKTSITEVIATGGVLWLRSGTYKINETLDFSALKGTNKAVTLRGAGAGNRFGGVREGATIIKNEHEGSAITAFGTLLSGESKTIVSLGLGGFLVENTGNIGATTYTIDLDYLTQFGLCDEIFLYGGGHNGNGFRLRNTTNGGTVQKQIIACKFEEGTGHYFAAEVTPNVETALNSGNSVHHAMQAVQCKIGIDVEGTTLFNSVSQLSSKCVNETDITGSIGVKYGEQAMQGTDACTHVERFSTGILYNGTRGATSISPLTSYPAGTPWLTTGSIESGKKTLTVADGTFWANGNPITVEKAGVGEANLETTVESGGRTTTLTLTAAASTTVSEKRVTGVSAGFRYFNSPKNCTVINHRASGHFCAARFDSGAGCEHSVWNAGGLGAVFSGEQIKKNITTTLLTTGRTGNAAVSRRQAAMNAALGILTESVNKNTCNAFKETVSETAVGIAVGLCAGEVVHGIALELENKPTSLTLAKVGLTNGSGLVLAKSADQHAGWEAAEGHKDITFESAFEVLEDDLYYAVLLTKVTGTKPKILCSNSGLASAITNVTNGGKGVEVSAAGVTDLTGTISWTTTASQLGLWLAVY